jgi:hypothetical protein
VTDTITSSSPFSAREADTDVASAAETANINQRVQQRIEASVAAAARGGPQAIERRLQELDREWDVERWLETTAASLALVGTALGATVNRRWYALPAAVGAFLMQHALQGWCPPLPVLRRMGVRTADEINQERYALKALRGDFAPVSRASGAELADAAVRAVQAPGTSTLH